MLMSYTNPNKTPEWYGRVYLCYENTNSPYCYTVINGFNCYCYKSFEDANNGHSKSPNVQVRHTMIPICKWIPNFFDRYILNWKLKNLYWGGNIRMFTRKI